MVRPAYQRGSNAQDLVKWFRGKVAAFDEAGLEAVEAFANEGAMATKRHIATRGTEWTRRQGRYGRIDTANMIDSVDSEITTRGKNSVQGNFGWIKNRELYFALQEGGFTIWNSGHRVEGMHAIADAAELAKEKFRIVFTEKAREA